MIRIIPDAYPTSPLLWAANQAGHTLLGAMLALDIAMVWFHVAGEYPYKTPLFVALALGYLIWVELIGQGWNGPDTIEDSAFVACGAAMMLMPYSEILPGTFALNVSPETSVAIAAGWQAYMFGGMAGRCWNKRRRAAAGDGN